MIIVIIDPSTSTSDLALKSKSGHGAVFQWHLTSNLFYSMSAAGCIPMEDIDFKRIGPPQISEKNSLCLKAKRNLFP